MATGRVRTIVFDCADLDRSVAFWSHVLGATETGRLDNYAFLSEIQPGLRVTLQQVPEVKTEGKNRVHIDVEPTDHDELVSEIVELGGKVLHTVSEDAYDLTVVADPDGNEFCVNQRLSIELGTPAFPRI